jgi:hypothetical protein
LATLQRSAASELPFSFSSFLSLFFLMAFLLCNASLSDLLAFAQKQSRIEAKDYLDPWSKGELRKQQISAWRRDCRLRSQAKQRCFAAFPGRLLKGSEALIPGNYGRLSIDPMGSIDYTIGQYAPREIYGALLSYLEATNAF